MKIDPGVKQVTLPPSVENRPAQAQTQASQRAETAQSDVSLSQRAAQMKQMETQLAAIPVVDQARVDSIKAAIASGQYTINAENIAAGLIDSVKEMLNAAK